MMMLLLEFTEAWDLGDLLKLWRLFELEVEGEVVVVVVEEVVVVL